MFLTRLFGAPVYITVMLIHVLSGSTFGRAVLAVIAAFVLLQVIGVLSFF